MIDDLSSRMLELTPPRFITWRLGITPRNSSPFGAAPLPVTERPRQPLIAGIVSSAGGIDALRALVAALPCDPGPGLALVVVPHLDPKRGSMIPAILSSVTKLPVREAADGDEISVNTIHVIPPNRSMTISARRLRVAPLDRQKFAAQVLDDFLKSLAADLGRRAIGVILSGSGNFGAAGSQEIRDRGGWVIAQDPVSALNPSMPRAAIGLNVVDQCLKPEAIATALVERARLHREERQETGAMIEDQPEFAKLLDLLREKTGRDFANYRSGMVSRRIDRRLAVTGLPNLAEYTKFVRENPEELASLSNDLLIGVTRFFRDPEVFQLLESMVVPDVLRDRDPDLPVRVWVPGCSTGQEAYSVAMLFLKQLKAAKQPARLQLFATDIDSNALTIARTGKYPAASIEEIPTEYRDLFVVPESGRGWRVNRELRDSVVFAPQNVLSDPPFSRLDFICCRNLLIYLEPFAQQSVLRRFAFALNPGGYLLLGPSETLNGQVEFFSAVSLPMRLFRRQDNPTRLLSPDVSIPIFLGSIRQPGTESAVSGPTPKVQPEELVAQLLLQEYAPAAVLIDTEGETIFMSGPVNQYLNLMAGRPTQNLLAMVRDGLRSPISELIRDAIAGQSSGKVKAWVKRENGYQPIEVALRAVPTHRSPAKLFLIVFQEATAAPPSQAVPQSLVAHLQHELSAARQDLQDTHAAMRRSNQDLRLANDDIISINEELQSTIEELETSKEELQSLNEELTTSNAQLNEKAIALEAANADIANLLNGTDLSAIFVGNDGRIRRFTAAATRMFRLIPSDVGRPLADITRNFDDDRFQDDIRTAMEQSSPVEREVFGSGDRWFVRRAIPYFDVHRALAGVIITLSDVTVIKRAEIELRRSRELNRLATVLMDSEDSIITIENDGQISAWNRGAEVAYGLTAGEAVGSQYSKLISEPYRMSDMESLNRVWRGEKVRRWDSERVNRDGAIHQVTVTATLLALRDGTPSSISVIETDISEVKRLVQEVRERSDLLDGVFRAMFNLVLVLDAEEKVILANPAAQLRFGYKVSELVGRTIEPLFAEAYRDDWKSRLGAIRDTASSANIENLNEMVGRTRGGETFPLEVDISWISESSRFVVVLRDISERVRLKREILQIATSEHESIGRELHDTVGQELTALMFMADGLANSHRLKGPSEDTSQLQRLSEGLKGVLSQVRMLSRGMVGTEVGAEGLAQALADLAAQVSAASKIRCEFVASGEMWIANDNTATQLLSIAREAVSNAVTHGKPDRITISLASGNGTIELAIQDDGKGIDGSSTKMQGIGIKLMRYRAELINARFDLKSSRNGTRVSIILLQEPAG